MNNEQPFPSDVQNMRFPVRAAANIPTSFLSALFNGDSEAAVTKQRNPSLSAAPCRKINAPEPCGFGFRAFFFVQQYAQLKTVRIPVYALSRVVGEPAVSVDFNTAISESVSAGSTAAMKDDTAPPPSSPV